MSTNQIRPQDVVRCEHGEQVTHLCKDCLIDTLVIELSVAKAVSETVIRIAHGLQY